MIAAAARVTNFLEMSRMHSRQITAHGLMAVMLVAMVAMSIPAPSLRAAEEKKKQTQTEARVWGALVYAGEGDVRALEKIADKKQFDDVRKRLLKVFPNHRRFRLIGEHTQVIFKEYESWVVPSKELYLKVDSRGPAKGGGTKLRIQVWQGDRVLVKSDAVLRKDRPLFIGGPKWRGGRLIFVVVLQP